MRRFHSGLALVVILLGVILLSSSTGVAKTRVIVWGLNPFDPGSKAIVDSFNKTHPDIQLMAQPAVAGQGAGAQQATKIITAVAAGAGPDVALLNRPWIKTWAARGIVYPLNDFIERDGIKFDDTFPAFVEDITWLGKKYAMPWNTDNREMTWNKALFREAGLDPEVGPDSWDDMLLYIKKLTKRDHNGKVTQLGYFRFLPDELYSYGWAAGGRFMNEDKTKVTLNHPQLVKALEFMIDEIEATGGPEVVAGLASENLQGADNPFFTGRYAMGIVGSWVVNDMARYAPDFEWGAGKVPTPEADGPRVTWGGGWSWAIMRSSKNVEAAWEVVKFLTSREAYLAQAEAEFNYRQSRGEFFVPRFTTKISLDRELWEKYAPYLDENAPRVTATAKHYVDLWSEADQVFTIPSTPIGAVMWDEMVRASDQAIFGEKTAKEALDEATQKLQAELDAFMQEYETYYKELVEGSN